MLDRDYADEVISGIVGEPGVRIVGSTPSSRRVTLHRTHLPLLGRGSPDTSAAWPSSDPRFLSYNRPPAEWFAALRDYQVADAELMRTRTGNILANDLGLGKTRTALAAGQAPYLIVCPKTAVSIWEDELADAGLFYHVLAGEAPAGFLNVKAVFEEVGKPDAWIVGYHVASAWMPYFCALGPTPTIYTLIADEAHYLQKVSLSWSKAFRRVDCRQTILMTATPIRNRLASLWPLLDAADIGAWGSRYAWRKKYCAAVPGAYGMVDGAPDTATLHRLTARLSQVLIKRTRADVAQDLPKLTRKAQLVNLDPDVLGDVVRETADAVIDAGLTRSSGQHLAWATAMRQRFGMLKVPTAVELVRELIDSWGRAVLWVWHDSVAKALGAALEKDFAVDYILGKTTQVKRDRTAREWKHGEMYPQPPRVLVASIAAASSAISLTTCGLSIFVEQDWAPLQMQQAEARTHRFGQLHSECLSIYLSIAGTIDEQIGRVLLEKAEEAERVLGVDGQVDQMRVLLGETEQDSDEDFMQRIGLRLIQEATPASGVDWRER